MKSTQVPARAPDVVTVPFEGATVVYHFGTGEVHRLDAIGSVVWHFVDGQTTVDEMVTDFAQAFEVDPDIVQGDIENLLGRLKQASLLADGPEPKSPGRSRRLTNPPSP